MGSTIVGGLPFGLVNLTVLNVTFEKGSREAIKIAHGAALVEVLFGLTALLAGGVLGKMVVLWMYMNLSNRYLSRSRIISKNINTIIGIVLFGLAFIQVLKI